jgi:predicted permease
MTELDLLNAIRDWVDSTAGHFMNFVTGLFAFLVASHFTGPQLSRTSIAILLCVFTVFSLITGSAVVAGFNESNALTEALLGLPDRQISSYVARESNISWTKGATVAVLTSGYVAGIAFLRESRKRSDA